MFSFRALILLGATIYLLPKDPAQQERFIASANQAMGWAATFCQRQPETCAKAHVVWDDLKDKAHFGFGVVYGLATRQMTATDHPGPKETRGWSIEPAGPLRPRGTLTSADMEPRWRGQQFQSGSDRH